MRGLGKKAFGRVRVCSPEEPRVLGCAKNARRALVLVSPNLRVELREKEREGLLKMKLSWRTARNLNAFVPVFSLLMRAGISAKC